MELFKLFGTIAVDNAEANRALDETSSKGQQAESRLSSGFSKIGSAAVKGAATLGGAVVGMVGSLAALVETQQQNVENFAKLDGAFERVGLTAQDASDTYSAFMGLLGDSDQATEASQDMANLAEAGGDLDSWYRIAAGTMAAFGDALPTENLIESANETVRTGTVTGGLADALNWAGQSADQWTQALSGNTEAQAAFATAVNEGKSVEDAFNEALAACNSTTERQALLQQALTEIYGQTGQQYIEQNENLLAYREAQAGLNETLAAASQAVMPFITVMMEMGTNLLDSVLPAVQQVGQALQGMLQGNPEAAQQFQESITNLFTTILNKVTEMLPQLLLVGAQILQGLLNGIIAALPTFIEGLMTVLPQLLQTFMDMVTQIVTFLGEYLPTLLPMLVQLLTQLAVMFVQALPTFIQALTDAILQLVNMLPTFIPQLLAAAVQLFMAMVDALPQILDALLAALPEIINTVVALLPTFLPMFIDAALTMFMGIVDSLPQILDALITAIPEIIDAVLNLLPTFLPAMLDAAVQLFTGIVEALPKILPELLSALGDLITQLPGKIIEFIPQIVQAGFDLLQGLITGFFDAVGSILDAIANVCGDILDGILGFFGIASPSKVMRYYAKFIPEGMALGVEDEAELPVKGVMSMSDDMLDAVDKAQESIDFGLATSDEALGISTTGTTSGTTASTDTVSAKLDRVITLLTQFFPQALDSMNMQVVMDTGALVGAIAPTMDKRLGDINSMRARGK